MSVASRLVQICEELLAPLVQADGGELWLVAAEGDRIQLHLAGTCAGCPGARITSRDVIEPALRNVSATVRVTITSGHIIPDGARLVQASERLSHPPPPR